MYMESADACDWCGKAFTPNEPRVPGYDNQPTHEKCQRTAQNADAEDQRYKSGGSRWIESVKDTRAPFTDWPNGQGSYE